MKKLLLNLTFTTLLLSVAYSQCDESNWESYYPDMEGCNLAVANLSGACLEGAIGFTQTNYFGTPILEGCAFGGGDCSFEDTDTDGYDDMSFIAGATSGDVNLDGNLNITDIILYIEAILAD